jgi:hypothetical protein
VVCIRLVLARDQWRTLLKTVIDFWFLYEAGNWLSNWIIVSVSRSTLFYPTGIRAGYQLAILSITTVRISHLTRTLFIFWFVFKRHPQHCEELLQAFAFYLVLEVNIIPWCKVLTRFHYGNLMDNFKLKIAEARSEILGSSFCVVSD